MTAAKSFRDAKRCLARRLELYGFSSAGDMLVRKVRDTVVVLDIQKDRYSTKEEIRFTVNVGISVDALRVAVAEAGGPSSTDVPRPEKGHWRSRLGRLLSEQGDTWWSVRDESTAQSVCEEVATSLIEVALPKIDMAASSDALVRSWQEGQGNGLTEYERRSNLAKLLYALNRIEEAKAAVDALEEACNGTSWEVSAKYDVRELRRQLG